jgi:hypothetical protein
MDLKNTVSFICIMIMGINGFLIVFRGVELTDLMFGKDPSERKRILGSGFWFLLVGVMIWANWNSWFK